MSQAVRGTPLRRNQGATSSSSASAAGAAAATATGDVASRQQHRRRLDDSEANWMDSESSTEADTDEEEQNESDEESHRTSLPNPHRGRQTRNNNNQSSASLSSSATLFDGNAGGAGADSGRAGGSTKSGGSKPLISYVTNDWQKKGDDYDEKKQHPYYNQHQYRPRHRSPSPTCCDEIIESGTWRNCLRVLYTRASVRVLAGWLVVVFLIWTGRWWFGGAAQHYSNDSYLRSSVQLKLSGALPRGPRGKVRGWFGSQSSPDFHELRQVGHLNESGWEWGSGKKLVVVGDVHGCAGPLEALLKKVKFHGERDHLAFTGDFVAKGPDTPRVLDIAVAHNASCVRGNHDDRVLHFRRDMQAPLRAVETSGNAGPITGKDGYVKERDLAAALSDEQIGYLKSCPLILDLGALPGLAPHALMVHAGLVPGLALDRQDPNLSMNMRSVDLRTHTPVKVHSPAMQRELKAHIGDRYKELPPPWEGKKNKIKVFDLDEKYVVPWRRLWEEHQRAVPKTERTMVVYGHDSLVGLADGDWAVGVDSGCVNGGSLSALVLEMKGATVRKKIVSVSCAGMAKDEEKKEKKKGGKGEKKKTS